MNIELFLTLFNAIFMTMGGGQLFMLILFEVSVPLSMVDHDILLNCL